MIGNPRSYNIAFIRKMLLSAFTPQSLRRFCLDHHLLRPVVERFGADHGLDDMVDEVIDYCRTQDLWRTLLASVRVENQRVYARFESTLFDGTAGLLADSRLVSTAPTQQPREVTLSTFLVYDDQEEALVHQIADRLERFGHRPHLHPQAFLAQQPKEFWDLESKVRQCHTSVVVLSDTVLGQMEAQQDRARRILRILQSRTGHTVALCTTPNGQARARQWGFSDIIDGTTWDATSDRAPVDLLTNIERDILSHYPSGNQRFVGLPFVVIAMTRNEAMELHQSLESLEEDYGRLILQPFHEVQAVLEPHCTIPFVEHYASTREEWKPFLGSEHPATMVIEDVVQYLNDVNPPHLRGRRIKPQYYSFDPLISGEEELRYIYREIAQTGCVVIVDEFSMFHPRVRTAYFKSPLSSSEHVALVTVSPFDPQSLAPNQVLERELRQSLADAFDRFMHELDPQCEFGIGDEHHLRRWLHRSLPETLHTLREPRRDRRKLTQFIEEVGHEPGAEYPGMLES